MRKLFVSFWLFCLPLAAADADFAKGILDRAEVIKDAAEVTRERYPDADDVLVDDHIRVEYDAEGNFLMWDDTYTKVLTEKGKREASTLALRFTVPFSLEEDVQVAILEIIKPDGSSIPIDVAKHSRITSGDEHSMAMNIYNPNDKALEVSVPGLEINDILHYVSRHRQRQPRIRGVWADVQLFEYTSPIRRYVYEVFGPKEKPLQQIVIKSEIKGTVQHTAGEKEGRLHYRWEVRDVPQMFPEPNMPALSSVVQRLLVSTAKDWGEISRWYWQICEPHLAVTPAMRQKVADLTAGVAEGRERIEAIFRFAAQEIRYLGLTVETESPGYEPHDASLTFERGGGVCRDKAALLVALLRCAGYKAYPTLIHTGPKRDPEAPMTWFNHAIVAVEDEKGGYLLLDCTDPEAKQMFPAHLGNKSYLVAKPDGDILRTSPVPPATDNLLRVETRAKVDAAGNLTAESALFFEGANDDAYRNYFTHRSPTQRREYFEGLVKAVAAGSRLIDFSLEPEDMRDVSRQLTARLRFEARDFANAGERAAMLTLPRLGTRAGLVNFMLDRCGLERRRYPLVIDLACGVRENLQVEIDGGLGKLAILPQYEPIADAAVVWRYQLVMQGQTLQSESEFLLQSVEIAPEQYLALKDILRRLERYGRQMLIFERGAAGQALASSEADAAILEERVRYDLADANNWLEERALKMKILTPAGIRRFAELKVGYNPAWEDVKLASATVTAPRASAEGAEEVYAIQPQEINVIDAGWVGEAPRYPPSKIFVASFPRVEIGSIIDYRLERRYRQYPFFAAQESFQSMEAIERKTVIIQAPRTVRLKINAEQLAQSGVRAAPPTAEGESKTWMWSAEKMPPVRRESDLPPWYAFTPTLFVSAGDWKAYAAEVEKALAMAAASGQAAIAAKAAEIGRDAADETAKIIALRDFVAKSIRAVGPRLNEVPLTALTPADRTFADGYGNSADRAALIFALCKAMGYKPEFALASWSPLGQSIAQPLVDYPSLSLFDSVLVRIKLRDRWLYLNDTDQYAAVGATTHDGRISLILPRGQIENVAAYPEAQDRGEIVYNIELIANGDARIRRARLFFGGDFMRANRRFSEMSPEERRRYYQEAVASISQSARPEGELVTDFTATPGREEFTVYAEGFAVQAQPYLYLIIPDTLRDILGLRADRREHPLYWRTPRRYRQRVEIKLPVGYDEVLLQPPEIIWRAPSELGIIGVASACQVDAEGRRTLMIESTADLLAGVIPAASYDELLDVHRRLGQTRNRLVLLKRTALPKE